MQIKPGRTVQWRRPSTGRMTQMVADLVHDYEGERWIFSRVDAHGGWIAVNQRYILAVK